MPASPIAVTMGEPAGIGGDITIKTWRARQHLSIPVFFLIDDPDRIKALAQRLGIDGAVKAITNPRDALETFDQALPVLPLSLTNRALPGQLDPANAPAVIDAITKAAHSVISGEACAMVTNPIHKSTLYDAGFKHPGHTEFLAHLCQKKLQLAETPTPIMMLAVDDLRTVPATIHIPLAKVSEALTRDVIVEQATILATALKTDFAMPNPRIAVAGLNPHAGEGGALGVEERDIIQPAIKMLQASGLNITGPHPADTLFHARARSDYDAVLAMYHDQALIPIKTIDFDRGVNITLGLPIIRTSPDHGTALDLAGTGQASPASLIEALYTARFIADTHVRNTRQASA